MYADVNKKVKTLLEESTPSDQSHSRRLVDSEFCICPTY